MIYHLHNSRTQIERTNRAINLLITYALNTCIAHNVTPCSPSHNLTLYRLDHVCRVFAVTTLITFLTLHHSLLFSAFCFILVRLYLCSFMSSLNSRRFVRHELNGRHDEMITLSRYTVGEALRAQAAVGKSVISHTGSEYSSSRLHHADIISTGD
ncbi:hypothetical protein HETIRDRAFT_417403 [Heterobasidion irregulare TC 32-1]|uniref:DUF6534 domain-containing protein n=1 Tax=Heterobasidion irregulare (strain TC 32-1) TaxID=747525 RepID=W4KCK7_HETIT|nr:uncharacterized protein HETIRDRAFT_417403 [Heterobasidion irregulare TC 32-1]ETW83513.1 hypothetical protein HETIRDRAFT_417403 [Heterobasidion irregulare TC 32-1]